MWGNELHALSMHLCHIMATTNLELSAMVPTPEMKLLTLAQQAWCRESLSGPGVLNIQLEQHE